jgi:hypothetical protein
VELGRLHLNGEAPEPPRETIEGGRDLRVERQPVDRGHDGHAEVGQPRVAGGGQRDPPSHVFPTSGPAATLRDSSRSSAERASGPCTPMTAPAFGSGGMGNCPLRGIAVSLGRWPGHRPVGEAATAEAHAERGAAAQRPPHFGGGLEGTDKVLDGDGAHGGVEARVAPPPLPAADRSPPPARAVLGPRPPLWCRLSYGFRYRPTISLRTVVSVTPSAGRRSWPTCLCTIDTTGGRC